MERAQIEANIRELEKQIKKTSKSLRSSKASVKEKATEALINYQVEIDKLTKQLEAEDRKNMRHAVPVRSTAFIVTEERTDVLKSTEDEILTRPINSISGTDILYMPIDRRQREHDYQTNIRDTIMKNAMQQSDRKYMQDLHQKLNVINDNLRKLEAGLRA